MTDPNLTLYLNGEPAFETADVAPAGLRLDRVLNAPARLTLNFAHAPKADFGDRLELRQGGALLFTGRIDRKRRDLDASGQTVAITASDALARLATTHHDTSEDGRSALRHIGRVLDRAGLSLATQIADFAIGWQVPDGLDDLEALRALLERTGLALQCVGDRAVLRDRTRPDDTIALDDWMTSCTETEEPDANSAEVLLGWQAGIDNALRPSGGVRAGRGPRAVSLREGEPAERAHQVAQARAQARCQQFEGTLTGLHDLFPGDRVGAGVLHRDHGLHTVSLLLDAADGPRTRIASAPAPAAAPAARPPSTLIAVVDDIDDPQTAGRVRVRIPALGNVRTGWLTCVGPHGQTGGGSGLGLSHAQGDPVALLAPEGDPARALVLGGVSRANRLQADIGPDKATRSTILRASCGQVALHDADEAVELSLKDGTRVRLEPGRITLSATDRLDLTCDGRVRIRGSRIDFEEA